MRNNPLFDQSITSLPANISGRQSIAPAPQRGTAAPADSLTIQALAKEGVTVAVLVYTQNDPLVTVGDAIAVGSVSYSVVAATRMYSNGQVGAEIYVTPCGPASA